MAVKMKSGALNTQGTDRWYVTDGANSVGPVRLELLTRGVEGGRVPLDSFVRHEAWKVWRPLTDFTDFIEEVRVAAGMGVTSSSRDPSSRDPLPQFPLSDRGLVNSEASQSLAARGPSLLDFANAEGVPSRRSTDSDLVPPEPRSDEGVPSPRSSAEIAIAPASWLSDDEDSLPGTMRTPMLPPAGTSDAPRPLWGMQRGGDMATDLSSDLLRDDSLELRAVFEREDAQRAQPRPLTDDVSRGSRSWGVARPAESTDALPDDDMHGANDLAGAVLLLVGGAVKRTRADVALLHRMGDHGAVVLEAFGLGELVGLSTSFVDPVVVAAAAGHLVLAEPHPGAAGASILRRLSPNRWDERELTGPAPPPTDVSQANERPIVAALMVPIQVRDRLFGFIELGRTTPFGAGDIAKADAIVTAFVRLIEARGLAI